MFDELLQLNQRAAADGNYETAYHLLMAALHCVDAAGGEPAGGLERLAAIAKLQAAEIEALRPPHHLSRRQAQTRGQTAIFDSYLAHVEAVRLRIESERQRRKSRPASNA
jgi:hypothetical protein